MSLKTPGLAHSADESKSTILPKQPTMTVRGGDGAPSEALSDSDWCRET